MKNEKLSAMKNPMNVSLIEMDLLGNEHTARLTFCWNAKKIKPVKLVFCHKQGIFNFEIVFSID